MYFIIYLRIELQPVPKDNLKVVLVAKSYLKNSLSPKAN